MPSTKNSPAIRQCPASRNCGRPLSTGIKADRGWQYEPEQVQVACGGKHGLYNMAQALLNPGDEVIIPAPYWVSYPPIVQLAGGTPVFCELREEDDFDINPDRLRACVYRQDPGHHPQQPVESHRFGLFPKGIGCGGRTGPGSRLVYHQ